MLVKPKYFFNSHPMFCRISLWERSTRSKMGRETLKGKVLGVGCKDQSPTTFECCIFVDKLLGSKEAQNCSRNCRI